MKFPKVIHKNFVFTATLRLSRSKNKKGNSHSYLFLYSLNISERCTKKFHQKYITVLKKSQKSLKKCDLD